MKATELLPPDTLTAELAYVYGARGPLSRLWRSLRASWRCARIAARQRAGASTPPQA